MRFDEEDLSLLQLTLGKQLEHLNQALTCFLNQTNVEVKTKHFDTNFEVAENFFDVVDNLVFITFNDFVELS